MLETVLTCILERTKDTFAASPVPNAFLQTWHKLRLSSEKVSSNERGAWGGAEQVWKRGAQPPWEQYEDYVEAREGLLQALAGATNTFTKRAREFASESRVKQQDMATIYSRNPVFVPDQVMEGINEIYIKHYHGEEQIGDGFNGLLCFSCHGCGHQTSEEHNMPVCKSTLTNYLKDVKQYLEDPALDLEDLDEDHPQRRGVVNAAIRLEPLHLPIGAPGRLALPLPTRTMIQDLWDYVMSMDGDVLWEVGYDKLPQQNMRLTQPVDIPVVRWTWTAHDRHEGWEGCGGNPRLRLL